MLVVLPWGDGIENTQTTLQTIHSLYDNAEYPPERLNGLEICDLQRI